MTPEVDCFHTPPDRERRVVRHQNLSTPAGFGQTATVIHGRTEEVPIPLLGRAVVNAGAHSQMWPEIVVRENDLDVDRRPDGVVGTREDRSETITRGGENLATHR